MCPLLCWVSEIKVHLRIFFPESNALFTFGDDLPKIFLLGMQKKTQSGFWKLPNDVIWFVKDSFACYLRDPLRREVRPKPILGSKSTFLSPRAATRRSGESLGRDCPRSDGGFRRHRRKSHRACAEHPNTLENWPQCSLLLMQWIPLKTPFARHAYGYIAAS